MCEVVEISDDEESFVPENDVGIISKNECLDYDLPQQNTCLRPGEDNVASSSGTNLRSSFIGMGFAPALVNKAIEENGEGNPELVLETLFAYSELQQPKTEYSDDGLFPGGNDDLAADPHAREAFHKAESSGSLNRLFGEDANKNAYFEGEFVLKEEPDVGNGVSDEKISSLLKMNFTQDEVRFAMDRLGKHASIGQLMDLIFAARMARKYEKDANNPIPVDEDSDNEALFGIMEKTLRLLEMGFTENEISAAFERCGSEATLPALADSIVAGGTGPIADKYSSSWSNSSGQIRCLSLKRKVGDNCQPFGPFYVKTEEYSSDIAPQVGTSALLEKLKGKMPEEEHWDEPNNWKKPKEEFVEDSSNSVGLTWLEARKRNSTATSNRVATSQRRFSHMEFEEEDRKPTLSIPNPCQSLTSVVAKPPYFLYGNVTNLSHDSWVKISQFLYSLQPEFVNTQSYSALRRREGYVHNLPTEGRFHILPKGPMTIEEAIPHTGKWWPSWDNRKQLSYINCETNGVSLLCDRLGRKLAESNGQTAAEQQRNLLQQCEEKSLIWVGNGKLAPLEPEHLESIMGYPLHHCRVAGFSSADRLKSLKLSFQTDTLGYHLSVLRQLYHGGVTVLSLFTGMGGAEVALHRLGIRLKGVVSLEPCEIKRRIVKRWWENSGQRGELIQIESINKLSSNRLEDLIKKFSGFDLVICQNPYSGANCDSLAGLDFSLFVEFVRVLQRVRSTMERNR
ncbi:DNA (cytosine-5-)-methyltransferase [Handroanthus impetiginosus]|uniref:DNA (Cytosine-5-)-methyltransferase n=1 Tax=Handroanthus impetiginosus TaxID=429701 RepID=A0A2G9HPL2_9LAMI|nr:DNA (cytosine-5-)-methyltransferase [Handroanthus impetiginosus]